jgi:hypothetical protein
MRHVPAVIVNISGIATSISSLGIRSSNFLVQKSLPNHEGFLSLVHISDVSFDSAIS